MKFLQSQILLSSLCLLFIAVEAMPNPHNNAKTTTSSLSKSISTSTVKTTSTGKITSKSSTSSSSLHTTSTSKTLSTSVSSSSLKTTSNSRPTPSTESSTSRKTSSASSSSFKTTSRSATTTSTASLKSSSSAHITSSTTLKSSTTGKTSSTSKTTSKSSTSTTTTPTGVTAPICTVVANSNISCGREGGCCSTDEDCCNLYGCAGAITGGIFGVCTSKLPLPPLPACNITQQEVQGIGGKCFLNGGCCNEDTDCCTGTECAGNAGQSEAGVCLSISEITSGNVTNALGTLTQKQIMPIATLTIVV